MIQRDLLGKGLWLCLITLCTACPTVPDASVPRAPSKHQGLKSNLLCWCIAFTMLMCNVYQLIADLA